MSETYKTLSQYSKSLEGRLKFWEPEPRLEAEVPLLRKYTLIGIPAAVVISG
jgi:hypothetical protein